MKVSKWGNSLAIRLPVDVIDGLGLKEGDDVQLRLEGSRDLTVSRKPDLEELFERIRKYRGLMPADFKFNREEANER